jgi:hypothetical protein
MDEPAHGQPLRETSAAGERRRAPSPFSVLHAATGKRPTGKRPPRREAPTREACRMRPNDDEASRSRLAGPPRGFLEREQASGSGLRDWITNERGAGPTDSARHGSGPHPGREGKRLRRIHAHAIALLTSSSACSAS